MQQHTDIFKLHDFLFPCHLAKIPHSPISKSKTTNINKVQKMHTNNTPSISN